MQETLTDWLQLLVRILRNSIHLQDHSLTHWAVWLYVIPSEPMNSMLTASSRGSTIGISAIAFVIAVAVPFFSYLIGLIGSLCCAPTCVSLFRNLCGSPSNFR